jgi:hypothetical protein
MNDYLYQSKPSEIEAVQWTGDNYDLVKSFADGKVRWRQDDVAGLELKAGADGIQEWVPLPEGHWVVRQPGDHSDYWPVDADYFARKYDKKASA